MRFDGETFDARADELRLTGQLRRTFEVMRDGRWRTLRQIAEQVGGSEASVSARLRDLRKERFGAWTVERRRDPNSPRPRGLWQYRLAWPVRINPPARDPSGPQDFLPGFSGIHETGP